MEQTPLSQINALMPLIEKIATDIATRIVNQKLQEAQYTVPKVPDHHHNGTDSSILTVDSIEGFNTLSANSAATVSNSGVVSYKALGNQTVRQGPQFVGYGDTSGGIYLSQKGIITSYPIPVINGYGVGVGSAFNGGKAPPGTLIYFYNGPGLSHLYVNIDGTDNWSQVA